MVQTVILVVLSLLTDSLNSIGLFLCLLCLLNSIGLFLCNITINMLLSMSYDFVL